jgi:hypothetical protein
MSMLGSGGLVRKAGAAAAAGAALIALGGAVARDPDFTKKAKEDVLNAVDADEKRINFSVEDTSDAPAGPVQQ